MGFLAALQLLTIIPVRRAPRPEDLHASLAYFPVVGVVIGLLLAGVGWLLRWVLPSSLVAALLVVAMVVVTGGLHLDGLSDTCDGLAGHRTVEERWRVMHDSRAGAFGVIGIALALLVKYVALGSMSGAILLPTLLLMPVASRLGDGLRHIRVPLRATGGVGQGVQRGRQRLALCPRHCDGGRRGGGFG